MENAFNSTNVDQRTLTISSKGTSTKDLLELYDTAIEIRNKILEEMPEASKRSDSEFFKDLNS